MIYYIELLPLNFVKKYFYKFTYTLSLYEGITNAKCTNTKMKRGGDI